MYLPVGYGGVPGLDGPEWLAEGADGGGGVEDDLGAVEAVHHPVLRVVPPVADVHGDAAELKYSIHRLYRYRIRREIG